MSRGTAVRQTKKVRQTGNTHEVVARGYGGDGKLQHLLYVNYTARFIATSCFESCECVVTIRLQLVTMLA